MTRALSIVVLVFTLLLPIGETVAQEAYELPRVGSHLDREDLLYFRLFPGLDVEKLLPERKILVEVVRASVDSVEFVIHDDREVSAGFPMHVRVSESAAFVLGLFLRYFEEFRFDMEPWEFPASIYVPDSLQRDALQLMEKEILHPFWPHWSREGDAVPLDITLRNGSCFQAYLLGMTNERLFLWTGSPRVNLAEREREFRVVEHRNVARIEYNEVDRMSAGVIGMSLGYLFGYAMAYGTSDDYSYQYPGSSSKDILPAEVAGILCMLTGTIGFAIPAESERTLHYSSERGEKLSHIPLHTAILSHPGLPPELRERAPLRESERIVCTWDERVPYILSRQLDRDTTRHVWTIGVEELIIFADRITYADRIISLTEAKELTGARFGARISYHRFLWGTLGSQTAFSVSLPVSFNLIYASVGMQGNLRFGPLEVSGGLRALKQQEQLRRDYHGEDVYSSRETTYYNRPDRFSDYLYWEAGIGLHVFDDISLHLHTMVQLSPSVTIRETLSGLRYTGDIDGSISHDYPGRYLRATGMSLQIQL